MSIQINTDPNPEDPNSNGGPSKRRQRGLMTALAITAVLHVLLAAAALIYFPELRNGDGDSSDQTAAEPTIDAPASSAASEPLAETKPPNPEPKDFDASVEKQVSDLVDKAEARDDAENRTVLEQKAAELEKISSPESIEKLAPSIKSAMKLKPRATEPAENPPKGRFDIKSAQFHSVRREADDEGKINYMSVMVDAEGRSLEIELDEAEGESIYKTMKLVEENPLLEKVYRELVIPALDKASQRQKP